jgi:hypothetical protein
MLSGVEAAITDVQSSHEGYFLIDYYHFFVMGPHEGNQYIIGMENDFDVGAELSKVSFGELRVDIKCHFGPIIYHNVDLYTCIGDTVENIIYPVLSLWIWPSEGKIRRNHPTCDKYLLLGA